jgi:hypothetical protein
MRIVLTVVGLSLLDDWLQGDLVGLVTALAKDTGAPLPTAVRIGDLPGQLDTLRTYVKRLKMKRESPTADDTDYASLLKRQPALAVMTEILRAVWRAGWVTEAERQHKSAERIRREHAPAELASLSKLTPKLGAEDLVWLLYSETCAGALCGAILAEALRNPEPDSTLCDGAAKVETRMLAGVQISDLKRLQEVGLESWATVLEEAWGTIKLVDDRVLLNITGGYKGLAPLGTLLAFGQGSRGRPIEVFYLYEESDELLSLPGGDLVHLDLTVFERFANIWHQRPTEGWPWPDKSDLLPSSFKEQVAEKRSDLLVIREGRLKLTTIGHLLLAVWRRRQDTGRKPAAQSDAG